MFKSSHPYSDKTTGEIKMWRELHVLHEKPQTPVEGETGLITVSGSESTIKTVYDISIEDGYTLKSLKSSIGGFAAFLAELGSWFRQDASTDVVIESAIGSIETDDCLMSTQSFSEKYYVARSDVDAVKLAVTTAELKNETVYLLRFAQSVAMTYDADISAQSSGITIDNKNQANRDFLDSLPLVIMLCGSMGTGKTTMLVDMTLSQSILFRDKAFEKMHAIQMRFPNFPCINFENDIWQEMKMSRKNLALIRDYVRLKWRGVDLRGTLEAAYGYNPEAFRTEYDDGLTVTSLGEALETYAQL